MNVVRKYKLTEDMKQQKDGKSLSQISDLINQFFNVESKLRLFQSPSNFKPRLERNGDPLRNLLTIEIWPEKPSRPH